MPSPPKPWEGARNSAADALGAAADGTPEAAPSVPIRPPSLQTLGTSPSSIGTAPSTPLYGSSYNRYGSSYGGYGSTLGGYNSYTSGYGGGYGGYGNYGGYGHYGGYSGYGMRPGFGGVNGAPNSTQALQASTQAAFDLLNGFVQSFGSFATMLDSTLHATFSSFNAMMAVADQVGSLRSAVGQVFSVFWLLRKLKSWIAGLITGKPCHDGDLASEFTSTEIAVTPSHDGPSMKKKPIFIFIALVFGFPYFLNKLVQYIAARLAAQQQQLQKGNKFDAKNIELARALYNFEASSPMELSLKCGDIVAVLEKPTADSKDGQAAAMWWRGKLQTGPIGWFPCNYVEILRKSSSQQSDADKSLKTIDENASATFWNSDQ